MIDGQSVSKVRRGGVGMICLDVGRDTPALVLVVLLSAVRR